MPVSAAVKRWKAANPGKNAVGSRVQVWNGNAHHTAGGLTKQNLKYNRKTGRIVSVAASAASKKRYNMKKYAHVKSAMKEQQKKILS